MRVGTGIIITCYPLLPVPRTRLSVALAIMGAIAGVGVSRAGWRSDGSAWRWGEPRAGLKPWTGLRAGWHAVVGRLGALGGIVLGGESSWWILLSSLRLMRLRLLLLAGLEARSWGRTSAWSLGGGWRVILKLLLLLLLWWARLRGSRLRTVSSRILHAILLLWWCTWLLLRRVSTWSLVLLIHLTINSSGGSLLYPSIRGLWWRGH